MTDITQSAVHTISADLVTEIRSSLESGKPVRHKFKDWGRLHIDRQLPFLCVYRRPVDRSDAGTKQLLLGEAAYILAAGESEVQSELQRLINVVIDSQLENFGAFLLIEIWSSQEAPLIDAKAEHSLRPEIRIVVDQDDVPKMLLERFESYLLQINISGQSPRVSLEYREQVAPPGMEALHTSEENDEQNIHVIGLEIEPVYRDFTTGEVFPFKLREMRQGLAHALKRGFYAFSHTFTTQKPAHYHELGRHAMTSAVWDTDRLLAEISDRFDLLLHVTPVNAKDAWREFQQSGFEQEPRFNYRPRPIDPDLLKRRLYQIPIERIEDPTLAYIFAAKRDELARQITMIGDRNTPRFMHGSQQVYGEVEGWLLDLAKQLVDNIPPVERAQQGEFLHYESFAQYSREEIARYKKSYPDFAAEVDVREDVSGILVSRGNFLIGTDVKVPRARLEATLAHEIGTHVVTYYNGRSQPFHQLHAGMAGYEPLQEGMAVLSEYLVGQLDSSRLRLLAGRVLAVYELTKGSSFVDTFQTLVTRHKFSQDIAFNITMRVYRSGGFTKDAVYLRGLTILLDFIADGGDYDLLFLGKIALEYLPFVEELKWRKVLKTGPLKPRYLELPEAKDRLKKLQEGHTLVQLVKECTQ